MLFHKRCQAILVVLLVTSALVAWGAKPAPSVSRPISYLTSTTAFNIAVVDESGTSSVTVNRNASDSYPRWSPDGLFLGGYYVPSSDDSLMIMSPSGANEHSILDKSEFQAWNLSRPGVQSSQGFEFFSSNCWLGTNAMIFAATTTYDASFAGETPDTPVNRLFIVDASGAIRPLTESASHGSLYDRDPHHSPALHKVVFATAGNLRADLFAIDPSGTGLLQITDFGTSVQQLRWPVWSPSGDRILVSARTSLAANWQLWILHVDLNQPNPGLGAGGRVTMIEPFKVADSGGGYVQTAAWSPDGKRIVFSRTVYDGRNRRYFELVIADAATGVESVIKHTTSNIEMPDWNPVP